MPPKPELTVTLTDNERALIVEVLESYGYQVKGTALIHFGRLLEGLLLKLKDTESQ